MTNTVVVMFQVFVLLLVAQFQFRIDVFGVLPAVMLISVLLSLIFLCIGMSTVVLIRHQQTSILATTFLALGFFLFSNALVPLEIMPQAAFFLAGRMPFVMASSAFQKVIIFGLSDIAYEIAALLVYLALALLLVLRLGSVLGKRVE